MLLRIDMHNNVLMAFVQLGAEIHRVTIDTCRVRCTCCWSKAIPWPCAHVASLIPAVKRRWILCGKAIRPTDLVFLRNRLLHSKVVAAATTLRDVPTDECAVCAHPLSTEPNVMCPTCHHHVHRDCLEEWLETSMHRTAAEATCVFCRSTIWTLYPRWPELFRAHYRGNS